MRAGGLTMSAAGVGSEHVQCQVSERTRLHCSHTVFDLAGAGMLESGLERLLQRPGATSAGECSSFRRLQCAGFRAQPSSGAAHRHIRTEPMYRYEWARHLNHTVLPADAL